MQETAQKIKVGISIGDLNGIGGEIILKSFEDKRMLDFCTPVIFASNKTISSLKNHFDLSLTFHGIPNASQAIDNKINVVNVWKDSPDIEFGTPTETGGEYAVRSLKAAVEALKKGTVDILVTAPINKKTVQSEAFSFPGHTDFLARELEGKSLGDACLEPTRIYTNAIRAVQSHYHVKQVIHGLAHITGGGFEENLDRILPKHLDAVIDPASWTPPAIFRWLQATGNVESSEMRRVFNMGIGIAMVVSDFYAASICTQISDLGIECVPVGKIVSGSGSVRYADN